MEGVEKEAKRVGVMEGLEKEAKRVGVMEGVEKEVGVRAEKMEKRAVEGVESELVEEREKCRTCSMSHDSPNMNFPSRRKAYTRLSNQSYTLLQKCPPVL